MSSSFSTSSTRKTDSSAGPVLRQVAAPRPSDVLGEDAFHRMVSIERKRSERSQRPFVLLLIDAGHKLPKEKSGRVLLDMLATLQEATRETDITGWYETNAVIGVMFTEISAENTSGMLSAILERVSMVLSGRLTSEQFGSLKFSFHLFPEEWDSSTPDRPSNPALYPDLRKREQSNRVLRVLKRAMDVSGGSILLLLLSPIFFIIAAGIKLTSRGPVLFQQKRIGEHGIPFTFLKFRSMYVNNNAAQHEEYVRKLIAGEAAPQSADGKSEGIFKLANDPRVTPLGKFLRRSSLDELPQLLNVVRGEMSLVGPRPPVPYEVEAYEVWHRRRLLEAKPGITGLWQVYGRSRVEFDEMVRLDLRYARACSPWLDLKILLQTPKAVIAGDGAC